MPASGETATTATEIANLGSLFRPCANGAHLRRLATGLLSAWRVLVAPRAAGCSTKYLAEVPAARPRSFVAILRESAPSRSIELTPAAVEQSLLAVERGDGLSPDICDALVQDGWVEWVDAASGLPIDENSPKSLLRATLQGRELLGELERPLALVA